MKETLTFEIVIDAPRPVVWDVMLGDESYRDWTRPFAAGSYYEGSWEEGARIRFLAPARGGIVADVAEVRPHEFVSLRHVGAVHEGVEDTTSDEVRAWAPAYENYTFTDADGGTKVQVELEVPLDWAGEMRESWPRALQRLKEIAEGRN